MAVAGCTFSSDNIVVKSPNDKRLYRYLELSNGFSVLLVHDPDIYPDGLLNSANMSASEGEESEEEEEASDCSEDHELDEVFIEENGTNPSKSDVQQTKKSAAAMCVGIGSFSDPLEAQGLTHFLEHMLFMGSTEFPDENEYDSYLSKHGGSSNAFTETEHTCYHFDVKREFLKGALRRFSQFFISPLVKPEAMEREVLAVDSEFKQVLQNDACRLQQLQCHTSSSLHPFNKFFWGNKKSLVFAMEKGVDLRARILKLYSECYHGGLMKLVVIGGETLDILHSWVLELFSGIREGPENKNLQSTEVKPIWKTGKLYKLEAVKDVHILELSWVLPSLRNDYLKKCDDYLAHLIGHEGKGSLYSLLKSYGWITSVSACVGNEGMKRSSFAYIFCVSIHLTNTGLNNIFDIIGFVYQYLKLLSPQEWIFKELENIADMEFTFTEELPQDDYAVQLAENLLVYPSEHVIFGDYAHKTFDETLIKHILSFFIPQNMRVDLLSKSIETSKDFNIEPWFGSKYIEEDIPPHFLSLWTDPPKIDESLSLPSKNEFIPRDFSIRASEISTNGVVPTSILDEPFIKLWYKLDETFKVPRASSYFRINLKGIYDTPRNSLLTELYVNLLQDELNEVVYQASVAKLDVSLSIANERVELKFFGFNHKLHTLLSRILRIAPKFRPREDRFAVVKEELERSLRNTNMKPLNHSSYLRLQVLFYQFWDVEEKLGLLSDLTISDVREFIPLLFSEVYIEGLCMGNMLEEEAMAISKTLELNLCEKSIPHGRKHVERVLCLPPGANFVRDVRVKNNLESNSVVELYYQIEYKDGGDGIRLKALIDLFDNIVEEPLFDQLRTKEQLGYVVDSGSRATARVLGYCFRVQSSKFDPVYLQERVEAFIDGIEEMLSGIDEKSFEDHKSGLIDELLQKDTSLNCEANRFWGQIVDRRYVFDMAKKEADEVRNVKREEVVEWYRTYLRTPSMKCRRLVIRVWGGCTDMRGAVEERGRGEVIDDLAGLKACSRFYPLNCGM